jgi:hypothetical protein
VAASVAAGVAWDRTEEGEGRVDLFIGRIRWRAERDLRAWSGPREFGWARVECQNS